MSNRKRFAETMPAGALATTIEEIRKEGHLTAWQYQAYQLIQAYLQASTGGSSAGLVMVAGDKVDRSATARSHPPGGSALDEQTARLFRDLRKHELKLLNVMATGRYGCLEHYGKVNSGFRSSKTARPWAIGQVQALLESVAELAQLKPELPPVPT